ncbi:ankyrin repeat and SOCS box protein 12 [Aplysia californica]|uniref:Ankyrin repeat and SOCS box protein 12 n=1 Tax=Aplysia californica TaxID=6500 RepID=A0ABM1A488_APLCA|nr:ankyrin repeat and SOCS box protein 12 [Aplysia californica]
MDFEDMRRPGLFTGPVSSQGPLATPPPPPPPPPLPPRSSTTVTNVPTAVQFLSDLSSYTIPETEAENTCQDLDNTSPNACSLSNNSHHCPQPSPKDVAEVISRQFRNCLPQAHGESDLHRAAFEGDAVRLQLLLDQIAGESYKFDIINQRNRLGCTPIRLAATGGHLECLTCLVDVGARIDIVDVKCQTPLFVAVKNRRLECSRKLLQSGACPDGDPGNSSTPLYVAFMNGDVRYVLLLLEYGAYPDKLRHISRLTGNVFNPRFTSLDAAVEYLMGEEEIYLAVKALLVCGCKSDNFQYHMCVYHNRERLIDVLHQFGVRSDGRDINNRLATELNVHNAAIRRLAYLRENPRSLLSACRIAIVSCQSRPRRNLDRLDGLPLPSALISYLKFSDV